MVHAAIHSFWLLQKARAISGELSETRSEVLTEYEKVCDKPVPVAVHEIDEGKVEIIE